MTSVAQKIPSQKNFPINILHVEDDLSDAEILRRTFDSNKEEYSITHSICFKDALKELSSNKFAILLLDLHLPDGKGLEAIEIIKESYPDLPVVIITGLDDETTAISALEKGAQEYVLKSHINGALIKQILQSSVHRKKIERLLVQKAYTDDLTGLPNRLAFEQTAKKMLSRAKRWKEREALLFIDLNKFKVINDTYGHEAGNIVLVETAKRLQNTLRQSDLIARYAGDEFICYLDSNKNMKIDRKLCQSVAEKITQAVEEPINIGDKDVSISLSIGIAIYPDAGEDFDALLKNADQAMYEAKNNENKKYCFIETPEGINAAISFTEQKNSISNCNIENVKYEDETVQALDDMAALQKIHDEKFMQFVYMASHDLQSPVRKLVTFSELLTCQPDTLSDEDKTHFLKRIHISAVRLQKLIESFASYKKILEGKSALQKVCLSALVSELIDDKEFFLIESRTNIQVDALPEIPVHPFLIRQVFHHLIVNAVTYKKPDDIANIHISQKTEGEHCVVCVKDNGIGIAAQYHQQVFKPFKRLHSADNIEGSGLGLTLAQKAIDKHHGHLWVKSSEGKGSEFYFSLPFDSAKETL